MQCRGSFGIICHRQVKKGQWCCDACLVDMLHKAFGRKEIDTSGLDEAVQAQRDRLAPKGR